MGWRDQVGREVSSGWDGAAYTFQLLSYESVEQNKKNQVKESSRIN